MRKTAAVIAVLACSVGVATTSQAAVVTLSESFFGSGRFEFTDYAGVEITLSATYDTADVMNDGVGGFMVASPLSENVTFGSDSYALTTDPTVELVSRSGADPGQLYIGAEPNVDEQTLYGLGPPTPNGFDLTSTQNVLTVGRFAYSASSAPSYDIETGDPSGAGGAVVLATPVTITETVSAAPEPSTWALMLAGIGAIGLALRLTRKSVAFTCDDRLPA